MANSRSGCAASMKVATCSVVSPSDWCPGFAGSGAFAAALTGTRSIRTAWASTARRVTRTCRAHGGADAVLFHPPHHVGDVKGVEVLQPDSRSQAGCGFGCADGGIRESQTAHADFIASSQSSRSAATVIIPACGMLPVAA